MTERLQAFHLPFGAPGATFSEEQDKARREALRAQVRALMPAADRLPNSDLVDRIGIKDDALTLYFDLEIKGQRSLPFGPAGENTPTARLYHDLALLRESAMDQQRAIYFDAAAIYDVPVIAGSRAAGTRIDLRRHALMREYHGTTLTIPFVTGPTVVEFPSYPLYRCDGQIHTISARVLSVSPFDVRLIGIRYVDAMETAATCLKPGSQRYALLPPALQGENIGLRCWVASVHSRRVILRVRTALDVLTQRIRHYEILEQLETGDLDRSLAQHLERLSCGRDRGID